MCVCDYTGLHAVLDHISSGIEGKGALVPQILLSLHNYLFYVNSLLFSVGSTSQVIA